MKVMIIRFVELFAVCVVGSSELILQGGVGRKALKRTRQGDAPVNKPKKIKATKLPDSDIDMKDTLEDFVLSD